MASHSRPDERVMAADHAESGAASENRPKVRNESQIRSSWTTSLHGSPTPALWQAAGAQAMGKRAHPRVGAGTAKRRKSSNSWTGRSRWCGSSARRSSRARLTIFIVSIASDLAWSARHFLRAHELRDDVDVSAEWRTPENPPKLADISMTVTGSATVEAISDALEDALMERVAARSLGEPPRLQLRCGR
jgi:hypothetical protein